MIMCSESEDGSSFSPENSDMEVTSEVETDQLESNESGGEMDEAEAGWTSKKGKIFWSPTNTSMCHYDPTATSMIRGPTHYATAWISNLMSSSVLLLMNEIVAMTNLHGRLISNADWWDVDRGTAGVCGAAHFGRLKNESILNLWSEKSGRSIDVPPPSFTISAEQSCLMTSGHDPNALMTSWLLSTKSGICGHTACRCCSAQTRMSLSTYSSSHSEASAASCSKYQKKKGQIWNKDFGNRYCQNILLESWRLQVYRSNAADDPAEVNQGGWGWSWRWQRAPGTHHYLWQAPEELLKKKLALVGTIYQNNPELLLHFLQARARAVFFSTFAFMKTHTLVSYIPRRGKIVLLLSTKHCSPRSPHSPQWMAATLILMLFFAVSD